MEAFRFQDTTATRKVFSLKKRIRAVRGGTSASKTISILVWCIDYAQSTKGEIISVVSETYHHLENGAMSDFMAIMKDRGYWDDNRWHGTKHEYTFEGGTVLQFISVDTYGKAHGPRRDVLFVNECNNLEWGIVDQLITRTRKIVWLDWNPVSEFWFDTEILHKRDDVDFITLTYLDNEALDEISLNEILSHKNNKRWWTVYGLGQVGDIEGRIYTGWDLSVDEIPHEARLERYGLDFGYTNDPTALIAVYYYNGGYILDEITYSKGLSNKQIADTILNQPRKAMVIADSAEPKSIDEIRSFGVNIQPTTKGPGSVLQRIQMMQDQQISVTKRSVNTINEYRKYLWETDKDGRITNEPSPIFNHAMDAAGYALRSMVPMIQRADLIANMPRMYQKPRTNPAV